MEVGFNMNEQKTFFENWPYKTGGLSSEVVFSAGSTVVITGTGMGRNGVLRLIYEGYFPPILRMLLLPVAIRLFISHPQV